MSMAFVASREKDTISSCMSALCLTDEQADVYFSFSKECAERIPAHKFILALRSPVFKAMCDENCPQNEGDINITDIKSDVFRKLMRYLYTDKLDINGMVAISLLYAAQKYQLPQLLSKCEDLLSEHLHVDNVWTIYSQANIFSLAELKMKALKFIAQNAMTIFTSKDFLSISPTNLLDILQLDSLCISEVNIYRSVLEWAESKLSQSNEPITGESRRGIMLQHDILYKIGIPLLTLKEYTTVVVPSGVLTREEELSAFRAITMQINSSSNINKFRMRPRNGDIINLSTDANLSPLSNLPFHDSRGYASQIMYIKASAAVMIVSAMIKSRGRNSKNTCNVDGERFRTVYEHGKSRNLEINFGVPANKTLKLLFEVEESDEHCSTLCECLSNIRKKYCECTRIKTGKHKFSNITNLEHANISLDCEGMRLVDSLNIKVLQKQN